jgi:hypothetical protein
VTALVPGDQCLGEHELGIDGKVNVLTDEHATGLQRLVPGEAKLGPVEAPFGRDTNPVATEWVWNDIGELGLECHRARRATDREIAGDFIRIPDSVLDIGALKDHLRIILGIEKVSRAKVIVAIFIIRADAGDVDLDLYGTGFDIRWIEGCVTRERAEVAADLRDHEMSGGEGYFRV